eukprot:jgi/Tetstr1/448033/TSEL_035334.t1
MALRLPGVRGVEVRLRGEAAHGWCFIATSKYVPTHSTRLTCVDCDVTRLSGATGHWHVDEDPAEWRAAHGGWPETPCGRRATGRSGIPSVRLYRQEPASVQYAVLAAGLSVTALRAGAVAGAARPHMPAPRPRHRHLHLADLGCGDGRVLLAAAGAHGVSGWGVELDESWSVWQGRPPGRASADVSIEQGDLLALPAARFAPGTVIFCYLLPAGLAKIAPLLREVLGAVPAALATLRWAVPGLEDLRLDAPDKGFRVYCSQRVRDTVIMST